MQELGISMICALVPGLSAGRMMYEGHHAIILSSKSHPSKTRTLHTLSHANPRNHAFLRHKRDIDLAISSAHWRDEKNIYDKNVDLGILSGRITLLASESLDI